MCVLSPHSDLKLHLVDRIADSHNSFRTVFSSPTNEFLHWLGFLDQTYHTASISNILLDVLLQAAAPVFDRLDASIVWRFVDDTLFSKRQLDVDGYSWSRPALGHNLSIADVVNKVDLQTRLVLLSDLVEGNGWNCCALTVHKNKVYQVHFNILLGLDLLDFRFKYHSHSDCPFLHSHVKLIDICDTFIWLGPFWNISFRGFDSNDWSVARVFLRLLGGVLGDSSLLGLNLNLLGCRVFTALLGHVG